MPDNAKEVTESYFTDFFQYAVDNLKPGTHYNLVLLGSGALILKSENAVPSYDFDMLAKTETELLPDDLVELIEQYADSHNFGYDWINDNVGVYDTIDDYVNWHCVMDNNLIFENHDLNNQIVIEIPTVETVVYKKTMVCRDKDLEQVLYWFLKNGYNTVEDIIRFLYQHNPYLEYAEENSRWKQDVLPKIYETFEGLY